MLNQEGHSPPRRSPAVGWSLGMSNCRRRHSDHEIIVRDWCDNSGAALCPSSLLRSRARMVSPIGLVVRGNSSRCQSGLKKMKQEAALRGKGKYVPVPFFDLLQTDYLARMSCPRLR